MTSQERNDDQWVRLVPLISPKKPAMGPPNCDQRTVIGGIFCILPPGCHGRWNTMDNWTRRCHLGRGPASDLDRAAVGQNGGSALTLPVGRRRESYGDRS